METTPVTLSLDSMATRFELVLGGEDSSRLRAIGEDALAEIERWGERLSIYRADSEMAWINAHAANGPVKVDPRIFRLLRHCADLSARTDSAFDITVAPLMRAWGLMGGSGTMANPEDVARAMEAVGMRHVLLDEEQFTVSFDRQGVMLDLGAVGKGYAVERAVGVLKEHGVTSALLHGGTSTVYAIGAQPDGSPWRIAIKHPAIPDEHLGVVDLGDNALGVSAVHGKSFTADGVQYGHVIDPRTGMPVQGALAAAVVGPSPTDCDALSTALLVLGESGLAMLVEQFPDYAGLVVTGTSTFTTDNWSTQ